MDTNVIGRKNLADPASQPQITRVFVRELTPETHGNAAGIGLADFTTARLVQSMDYRATVINCVTAAHPQAAMTPFYYDTDREVIDAALGTIGLQPPEQARIVRIRDTLHLDVAEVSEPCLAELTARNDAEAIGPALELAFDGSNNLMPMSG